MLVTQFFLFLLWMFICVFADNTNQNDLSLSSNSKQRIKRSLFSKLFKSKSKKRTQAKNNEEEDIFLNNKLYISDNEEEQSQSEPNKGYTQQELAEIQRILSKKENDYYGILDINSQATEDKIEKAYKKLSPRVHPDKINAPGATEASQRLNKARDELVAKFENQNPRNNQQATITFTTRLATLTKNRNRKATDMIDKSYLISTFSPLSSEKATRTFKSSSFYFLFASVILIIGIIIFIIYWKKRRRHSSSSILKNKSKKANLPPTSPSPRSNDGDATTIDSEVSMVQDEE